MGAHMRSIAFENVDIVLGKQVSMESAVGHASTVSEPAPV